MPSEAIVMPSWQADRYSSIWSTCLSASAAPRTPVVAHLLEPGLTRAHEAELGRHEEAVGGDQNHHPEQEQEFCH